jgi:tetratricopeptide (TPR) repeat protein
MSEEDIEIHAQMASQFLQAGRVDQAITMYRKVLGLQPDNLRTVRALGRIYATRKDFASAEGYCRRALELAPANPDLHVSLGELLREWGRFDAAEDCYRTAIGLQPDPAHLYYQYSVIHKFTDADELGAMEDLWKRRDLDIEKRRSLGFALGKAYDDLGQYDHAFECFQEANRIARQNYAYSIDQESTGFESIRKVFSREMLRRTQASGVADDCPLIVTGLPRSGSTLVEQILASHPDVYGAGELRNFHDIVQKIAADAGTTFPTDFDQLSQDQLLAGANQYIDELKTLSDGERHVVDKNMGSVLYIGLISMMLPAAKIVYCVRDPRDQGLSFFQKYFGDQQTFSYDLRDIGRYYRLRHGLMEYWSRVLPGKIYQIKYEELIHDPEAQIRRLLDFCSLTFDESCLNFHQTERHVNTASLDQVRQPIYSSSVGRWKHYARQLQPLIDELNIGVD